MINMNKLFLKFLNDLKESSPNLNKSLKEIGYSKDVKKIVFEQAKLAKKAKLTGLVIESNKVILVSRDLIIDMLKNYNMFLVATNFSNKGV